MSVLRSLKLDGVGPAKKMEVRFGDRLNIITGDNGLGKSFLLDIAWWALTRTWPRANEQALPRPDAKKAEITTVALATGNKSLTRAIPFSFAKHRWIQPPGKPAIHGLVIYAQVDGGFSVWDPARNYSASGKEDYAEAYQFRAGDAWSGLQAEGVWQCNGLIRDWAKWQLADSEAYRQLVSALLALSPPNEELRPGKLMRISPEDSQDYPSISMPYGIDVPVVQASAGIRRILALAYLLVWSWQEHLLAVKLRRGQAAKRIIFLVDEAESHLHPTWQRRILPSVLKVVNEMIEGAAAPEVQVIASTHSPLVCLSMETIFDSDKDRLLDIDLNEKREAEIREVVFSKLGTAEKWLLSESFGLETSRSEPAEAAVQKAAALWSEVAQSGTHSGAQAFQSIDRELRNVLPEADSFWVTWNRFGKARGLIK